MKNNTSPAAAYQGQRRTQCASSVARCPCNASPKPKNRPLCTHSVQGGRNEPLGCSNPSGYSMPMPASAAQAPATGKRVIGTGQFMRQVKNGKVVAEWQTTNSMGLMAQMGALPTH